MHSQSNSKVMQKPEVRSKKCNGGAVVDTVAVIAVAAVGAVVDIAAVVAIIVAVTAVAVDIADGAVVAPTSVSIWAHHCWVMDMATIPVHADMRAGVVIGIAAASLTGDIATAITMVA